MFMIVFGGFVYEIRIEKAAVLAVIQRGKDYSNSRGLFFLLMKKDGGFFDQLTKSSYKNGASENRPRID